MGPSGAFGPTGAFDAFEAASSSGRRRRMSWRRLAGPLCVLVAVPALVAAVASGPSETVSDLGLYGTRGPVCERFVLVVDQSGSMQDIAAARDAALAELLGWLPRNLRRTDELAVVDFAASSAARLAPTRVGDLAPGAVAGAVPVEQGSQTLFVPAAQAVASMGATECDVNLLLLSDGRFGDSPADPEQGRRLLLDNGVHDLHLLVPSEDGSDPGPEWGTAFPNVVPLWFDGDDPQDSALAVAEAVAAGTGQVLVRERAPVLG